MTLPVVRSSAPLGRWDSVRDFAGLHDEFGRLVRSVFGDGPLAALDGELSRVWQPLADVTETEQAYEVEVEVPGLRRDDVTIEAVGNELTITGEYREREKAGVLRHRTRRSGRFEYRALLPREVDADRITAELADGVLTVTVPKAETAKPRRIEITAH